MQYIRPYCRCTDWVRAPLFSAFWPLVGLCNGLHSLQKSVSLRGGERASYWAGLLIMASFTADISYFAMLSLQRIGTGRWERNYESKYLAPGCWFHHTGVWLKYRALYPLNLGWRRWRRRKQDLIILLCLELCCSCLWPSDHSLLAVVERSGIYGEKTFINPVVKHKFCLRNIDPRGHVSGQRRLFSRQRQGCRAKTVELGDKHSNLGTVSY